MNNKYLIIAVCVLLVVALSLGYSTLTQSFNFVNSVFNIFSSTGKTVLSAFGMDFDSKLDNFLPDLMTTNSLGSYYDENTQTVVDIRSTIISYLPEWLIVRANDKDSRVSIKIYPSLYSADFDYYAFHGNIFNNSAISFGDSLYEYGNGISKQYCLRLEIRVPIEIENGVTSESVVYDTFIFYHNGSIRYFVTYETENIGIYSDRLNGRVQYSNETDISRKLNGDHELRVIDKEDTIFFKYQYSVVRNLQSTQLYINNSFDLFLKGE